MRNSPPGSLTRFSGLGCFVHIFEYGELQLALVAIDAVEDDADWIADGEFAAGALAHDFANVLLISVLVAGQAVDGDESFDEEIGEFDEEAVFGGGDDEGVEIFADATGHELDL